MRLTSSTSAGHPAHVHVFFPPPIPVRLLALLSCCLYPLPSPHLHPPLVTLPPFVAGRPREGSSDGTIQHRPVGPVCRLLLRASPEPRAAAGDDCAAGGKQGEGGRGRRAMTRAERTCTFAAGHHRGGGGDRGEGVRGQIAMTRLYVLTRPRYNVMLWLNHPSCHPPRLPFPPPLPSTVLLPPNCPPLTDAGGRQQQGAVPA